MMFWMSWPLLVGTSLYWNTRNFNKSNSSAFLSKINQRIKYLTDFPEMGKIVEFKNTRAASLGHYNHIIGA